MRKKGYSEISHSRMRRYEILLEFVKEELEEQSAGKSGNQDPEVENPAGKAAEDCRGMETATWGKGGRQHDLRPVSSRKPEKPSIL